MKPTTNDGKKTSVTILGVHMNSPAYPNTHFVVHGLRCADAITCREINTPMLSARPRFTSDGGSATKPLKTAAALLRIVYSHASVLLRFAFSQKSDVVYLPYPSVGILFLLSLLPTPLRPRRLIADAFISIYDTAVTDRQLLAKKSCAARLLRRIERRAYRTATLTTVDTEENRQYYAELFRLPESCFIVLPLATDEAHFAASDYTPSGDESRVLFIGTFVPLQGTDVIAQAIMKLRERPDIRFTILGTGQTASAFAEVLGATPPETLSWITDWQESKAVAEAIKAADVCLGIFSAGPKADRVWPFKNYAYMACGRPIVTADTACSRRMLKLAAEPAFATVPAGNADALAAKLIELADSAELRQALARESRRFYESHLSNSVARARLFDVLLDG